MSCFGSRESPFDSPLKDALAKRCRCYIKATRTFIKMQPFSPILKPNILARIFCLLCPRSPTAVIFFVWSVVVDTIKSMGWAGTRAHIPIERSKIPAPFIVNNNSPTPIVMPCAVLGIAAALFHCTPNAIFSSVKIIQAVRCAYRFTFYTSARFCVPGSQALCNNYGSISARTLASPQYVAFPAGKLMIPGPLNNSKTAKLFADHIDQCITHGDNISNVATLSMSFTIPGT